MPTEHPEVFAELEQRVLDLSHEVRYLKGKLDSLESEHKPTQPHDAPVSELVLRLTRSLFGDDIQLVEKDDPEIPGENYAMLYVRTALSDDEIARKENEWHKLVRAVALGKHGQFRIFVDAR